MGEETVLWVGVDGLDVRLLEHFEHPFWATISDRAAIVEVPKPEPIDTNTVTRRSPRLWSRYYTGVRPYESGILGFWERLTADGDGQRAEISVEWVNEHECEKLVDRQSLLVPPVWTLALKEGYSVGLTTPWFSYPLTDAELDLLLTFARL